MDLPLAFTQALQPQPPTDYHRLKAHVASLGGKWPGLPHPCDYKSPENLEPPAGKSRFKPAARHRRHLRRLRH